MLLRVGEAGDRLVVRAGQIVRVHRHDRREGVAQHVDLQAVGQGRVRDLEFSGPGLGQPGRRQTEEEQRERPGKQTTKRQHHVSVQRERGEPGSTRNGRSIFPVDDGMREKQIAPFGTWPSPITPELVTGHTVGFSELAVDGDAVLWLEQRAAERGRRALVRRQQGESPRDVLPATVDVGSRVHEYGGGAFAARNGRIVYSERRDGSVWVAEDGAIRPLVTVEGCRYAGFAFDPARASWSSRFAKIIATGRRPRPRIRSWRWPWAPIPPPTPDTPSSRAATSTSHRSSRPRRHATRVDRMGPPRYALRCDAPVRRAARRERRAR